MAYIDSSKFMAYIKKNLRIISLSTAFIIIFCFFSFASPYFLSVNNIITILNQISAIAIVALFSTFVIISGGIDISVGSIISFSGIAAASFVLIYPNLVIIGYIIGILVGVIIGIINGSLVTYGKVTPFIGTLATMSIFGGLCYIWTGGYSIYGVPTSFSMLGRGRLGIIPINVIILIVITAILYLILENTQIGVYIRSIGGNRKAAGLVGLNIKRYTIIAYIFSGFGAGLAGVIMASRVCSGVPAMGEPFLFDIIIAIILGGTSLSGGIGNIQGTLFGAFILGILGNGFNLLNVSSYLQLVIRGFILAAVVILDMHTRKR